MHFSQLELIQEKINLLTPLIYKSTRSIDTWKRKGGKYGEPVEYYGVHEMEDIHVGDHYRCRYDDAFWFEADVTVPKEMAGERLVLELSPGGECLVSVDGVMRSSLAFYQERAMYGDQLQPRERVDLCDKAVAGQIYHVSIEVNLNYKDFFKKNHYLVYNDSVSTEYQMSFMKLCAVDADAEEYWTELVATMDLLRLLRNPEAEIMKEVLVSRRFSKDYNRFVQASRDDTLCTELIHAMGDSLALVPFFTDKAETQQAIPAANRLFKQQVAKIRREKEGVVYMSGYAHIDLVWLWQEKQVIRKIANTCLNAIALSDRYPEFIFTLTQPYAYAQLEKYYPDVFRRVQQKIAEGKIDPCSNLWVEMDTNLAGGEAIVRQLLYGRAYYLEKFGKASDVFLMPDSFGYAGSLPQIMKRAGLNYFMTNKLSMNEKFRFPYTFFQWEGIDGTRIAAYEQPGAYNGRINPKRIEQIYRHAEDKHLSDEVYATFGYGDGGGGPDYKMLEDAKVVNRLPGLPTVKFATYHDFFKKTFKDMDKFPVWSDELYLDRHRATYTSQGAIKKKNRASEFLMRRYEMAVSLREILLGIPSDPKETEALWKMFLHMQFHDSLPGSSITQAMEDAKRWYDEFLTTCTEKLNAVLSDLAAAIEKKDGAPVWFNFLSWDRKGLDAKAPEAIPAIGWTAEKPRTCAALTAEDGVLENQFFRLRVDENGRIASLYDKRFGRETQRKPGNEFFVFEEIAKDHLSAWDMHPEMEDCVSQPVLRSVKTLKAKKGEAAIRVEYTYRKSRISQDIVLYDNCPRVDFRTKIDWNEDMRLLKTAFYPAVHSNHASYEIQFGTIERPTHRNTAYDQMRFESCCHKWADLSQKDYGLSFLNDSKYGLDVCADTVRLTLLHAPMEPDCTADRGHHEFVYSLFPHDGAVLTDTVRAGYELNEKEIKVADDGDSNAAARQSTWNHLPEKLPATFRFLTVDAENCILDTFKKAEDGDGFILRFYECAGAGGTANVRFAKAITSVTECDLMEQNEKKMKIGKDGFRFDLRPYVIRSFRVKF